MKKKLISAKNFVKCNEVEILIGTTVVFATIAGVQQIGIRSLNKFLKDKNLFDEYYFVDEI